MKTDRNISRMLAQSAFVMNTIGGGLSMAISNFGKKENHYLFRISVPGVDADRFSIEIHNHDLFIYQKLDYDNEVQIPYMLQRLSIPANVDYEQISANYSEGQLSVVLPFNELAGGYQREVEIFRS